MGWDLSAVHHSGTVTQLSFQQGGGIWWTGSKTDRSGAPHVLCAMELLSHSWQESQFIIPMPLLTDFNVTKPHTVVVSVSFHCWQSFRFNLSVKQPFAWDVRHLLTTVPVLPSEWWHWWWHTVGSVSVWAHSCHWHSPETIKTLVSCYASDHQGKAEKRDLWTDGGLCELYLSTTHSYLSMFGHDRERVWSETSFSFTSAFIEADIVTATYNSCWMKKHYRS